MGKTTYQLVQDFSHQQYDSATFLPQGLAVKKVLHKILVALSVLVGGGLHATGVGVKGNKSWRMGFPLSK